MAKERRSVVLAEDTPREDRVVQTLTGVSRSWVRGMFDHGCVSVDGVPCTDAGQPVPRGAMVEVVFEPGRHYREVPPSRPNAAFRVAWEDSRIIVVEKVAGILTIPTEHHERDTLVSAVAHHFSRGRQPQEAFVVHRLDRDTSGLLVFSRSETLAQVLRDQFAAHKPEREYAAIVAGNVEDDKGTFRSYMFVDEDLDQVSSDNPDDGKLAVTHYEVVERLRGATFVRVHLETGRRNQIRVHFADAGHPVLGDTRYSPDLARHPCWREPRLALHARTLGFKHPGTGRPVRVTTELPPVFVAFLAATRIAPAPSAPARPRLPKPPPNPDAPLPAPAPLSPKPTTTTDKRRERVPWAALLRRVLDVDALACPRCSTPMIILAFLTDPPVVRKILLHLGLPAEPPVLAPARCYYDEPAYLSDFAPDPPFFDDEAPPPVTGWTARAPP